MNRLSRWCALMLLALGVCFITALPTRAATATATLQQGPLSVTPTYVTVTYHAGARGSERTIASSFSATVTDARGTKAGWEISAATVSTSGPSGDFPTAAHVITDFNITFANGTPPDPTGPCDVIPTAPAMILHNRPDTGMGQSTENFSTLLTLDADARGGTYSATLMLTVAPIGTVNGMPSARPPSAPTTPGSPSPAPAVNPNALPSSRTTPGSASVTGTPDSAPVARPNGGFPLPPSFNTSGSAASTTATQRVAATNNDSVATQPATAAGGLDSSVTNAKTTAPTAAPTTTQANVQSSPTNGATTPNDDSGLSPSVIAPAAPAPASIAGTTVTANPNPQRGASPDPLPSGTTTSSAAPSASLTYPVIAVGGETMTLTLPFVPSLYNPLGGGAGWHLQTSLGLSNASSRPISSTMLIRTNAGRFFNTVINPDTNQATLTFNPLLAAQDGASSDPGSAVLIITIVAGP